MTSKCALGKRVEDQLLERNETCEEFFSREALRLAHACPEMAARFRRGGRLPAFGRGLYVTDAQHVSVEFVPPVIVGKRALPALDRMQSLAGALPILVKDGRLVQTGWQGRSGIVAGPVEK